MGSEWKMNLDFNGRANEFYNGNEWEVNLEMKMSKQWISEWEIRWEINLGKRFEYNEWLKWWIKLTTSEANTEKQLDA